LGAFVPLSESNMIPTTEARQRILAALAPVSTEWVGLTEGCGRVLAEDLAARLSQPPDDVSAMDGYALRQTDVKRVPTTLTQVGEAPAGGKFAGTVQAGQCVRIFTGGPVPAGADTIVIQEHVAAAGPRITIQQAPAAGMHIRRAGLDFRAGQVALRAGLTLSARDIGLAAAMDRPWLRVRRRPRVAIVSTGDELELPGDPLGPNQIVASNGFALSAFAAQWGALPIHLGIVRDRPEEFARLAGELANVDLLVTSGGASVGDYDLVRSALGREGLAIDFWQIAMRPGKPLLFGKLGATPVLGLPGNPVSALVCALLFLRPAILRMLDVPAAGEMPYASARLGRDLPGNDGREDFLRAELTRDEGGHWVATPFPTQDSSMLSLLARSGCLVRRPPDAPAAQAGETVQTLVL
jgi:molybdopterin molybdotransferase